MKSPSLIVHLCPSYVDLERETGGVANVVRHLCLQLARMGRQVHLVCGNRELGRMCGRPGNAVHTPHLTRTVLDQKPHPLFGPVDQLGTVLGALPQDCIVHVHTCFSAFTEYAMAVLRRRGIPYIFTPHGKLSSAMMERHHLFKKIWWSLCARNQVRAASSITLVSSQEGDQLSTLGVQQVPSVIPNGYEQQEEHSAPLIEGPYILFLGYLDPRKQPEFLVRAFASSRVRDKFTLVFAGPDAYGIWSTVVRVIEKCGVRDRVVWFGPAYGSAKWNLLNNATCLCLPSKAEGLPVVMCEALGAGLPIVYSKGCNFPEVQKRGAGVLVEEFAEMSWAKAIELICLDEFTRQRMRKAAEEMGQDYSWKSIAGRWCQVYDALAANSEGSRDR